MSAIRFTPKLCRRRFERKRATDNCNQRYAQVCDLQPPESGSMNIWGCITEFESHAGREHPLVSRPIAARSFSCAARSSDEFVELAFNPGQFFLLVP